MLLIVALLLGLWYALLRLRIAPIPLMRGWFLLMNVIFLLPASAFTLVLDSLRHVGVPKYYTSRMCVILLIAAFRTVYYTNPQIQLHLSLDTRGPLKSWGDIPRRSAALVGNHTSFWDVYIFLCAFPLSVCINSRTLMKSTLRQLPIVGGIFDRVGHFPVYFKSDEDGNFSVDKERQAAVMVGLNEHIRHGGVLAVFPEGAINKTPAQLQNFRFGTFSTIFEHRLPVYYLITSGNEKTWPRTAAFGGYPADIYGRIGSYPIDFDKQTSAEVAGEMKTYLQGVVDDLGTK